MSIVNVSPERDWWLKVQHVVERLGLDLIDSDTALAQKCFNLAARIDSAYGITSQENALLMLETLARKRQGR